MSPLINHSAKSYEGLKYNSSVDISFRHKNYMHSPYIENFRTVFSILCKNCLNADSIFTVIVWNVTKNCGIKFAVLEILTKTSK